jgi:hypothetical protein
MKKMIMTFGIAAAMGMAALPATAKGVPGSGPNPFSDCGIGAALFENNVLATISNILWDLGTTGVTSATASPETCNGKTVETAQFIIENYNQLAEETARGNGDYLTGLLDIAEVAEVERADVVAGLRAHMASVTAQPEHAKASLVEKSTALYQGLVSVVPTA